MTIEYYLPAGVMKLVDVPDSKSGVVHPTCRFDSGHRQINKIQSPLDGRFFNRVEPTPRI